jgi:hypothetical protein
MTEIVIQPRPRTTETEQRSENWLDKLLRTKRDATYFYLLSSMTVFMFILIILLIIFLCVGLRGLKSPMYTVQVVDEHTKHVYRQVNQTGKSSSPSFAQKYTACGEAYYPVNSEVARSKHHRTARIIRGFEANPHSQPWLISLRRTTSDGQVLNHVCGGALITERHVLTAAHCVADLQTNQLAVVVGLQNLYEYSQSDVYSIEKIIAHEEYSGVVGVGQIRNDLAILKLDRMVTKSDTVQTICLPASDSEVVESAAAIVAGWGDFGAGFVNQVPENLQIVKLKVMSSGPICDASGSWYSESTICAIGDDTNQANICFGKLSFIWWVYIQKKPILLWKFHYDLHKSRIW